MLSHTVRGAKMGHRLKTTLRRHCLAYSYNTRNGGLLQILSRKIENPCTEPRPCLFMIIREQADCYKSLAEKSNIPARSHCHGWAFSVPMAFPRSISQERRSDTVKHCEISDVKMLIFALSAL